MRRKKIAKLDYFKNAPTLLLIKDYYSTAPSTNPCANYFRPNWFSFAQPTRPGNVIKI